MFWEVQPDVNKYSIKSVQRMNIQGRFCGCDDIHKPSSFNFLPSHSQCVGIWLLCWLPQGHKMAVTVPGNVAVFKDRKEKSGLG